MNTTDNGKMVNISLEEAKSLYQKGFPNIALRAYPLHFLEKYADITYFNEVCDEIAKAKYSEAKEIEDYSDILYDTDNPLEKMMLINKAMHLYSEKNCHHYYFLNKWGNVVKVKNPSTIQEKTFCFISVEMAKHVWKNFKDEVIAAADYVADF